MAVQAHAPPEARPPCGYDLDVEHLNDCDSPRPETTSWYTADIGELLLVVTRCSTCGAPNRRRAHP